MPTLNPCVTACMFVWVQMNMYVCACGSQRSPSNVIFLGDIYLVLLGSISLWPEAYQLS